MYKNILCAIDTSSESKIVLDKAKDLADKYGADLSVIHVIEYGFLPKDYQKQLEEEVKPKINAVADEYQIKKKLRYVKFGQPYTVICETAEQKSIDLILTGSHGKHGVKALLGSTANGVLHHAKSDVLVIKVV